MMLSSEPHLLHPPDRALLRPPSMLGQAIAQTATGIAFLRRTEYITGAAPNNAARFETTVATSRKRGPRRKRSTVAQDDPNNIVRHIAKGFNIAYPHDAGSSETAAGISQHDRDAWQAPKHPGRGKEHLKLLDAYPVLPDLAAVPDTGSMLMFKFISPPVAVSAGGGDYDPRLDVALLRPSGQSDEDAARYRAEQAAHEADPAKPAPLPRYQFEYFLPREASARRVAGIKRYFSARDAEGQSDDDGGHAESDEDKDQVAGALAELNELTGGSGGSGTPHVRYHHVRFYDTDTCIGNRDNQHNTQVALALHDPEAAEDDAEDDSSKLPPLKRRKVPLVKAAYYYPVISRTSIRPRRAKQLKTPITPHFPVGFPPHANAAAGAAASKGPSTAAQRGDQDGDTDIIDVVEARVRAPNAQELARRDAIRRQCEGFDVAEEAHAPGENEVEDEGEDDGGTVGEQHQAAADEDGADEDAEGEEDDE